MDIEGDWSENFEDWTFDEGQASRNTDPTASGIAFDAAGWNQFMGAEGKAPSFNGPPPAVTKKRVLLVSDPSFVDTSAAVYLMTTLSIAGFEVTREMSIPVVTSSWEVSKDRTDVVIIPAQMHGSLWTQLTLTSQNNLKQFVENGGVLVSCHFRGTEITNGLTDLRWHETGVPMGKSQKHRPQNNAWLTRGPSELPRVNDVRGILCVKSGQSWFRSGTDFTTIAGTPLGDGFVVYLGHDFSESFTREWNRVLCAICQLDLYERNNRPEFEFDLDAIKRVFAEFPDSNGNVNGRGMNGAEGDSQGDDNFDSFVADFTEQTLENIAGAVATANAVETNVPSADAPEQPQSVFDSFRVGDELFEVNGSVGESGDQHPRPPPVKDDGAEDDAIEDVD